MATAADADAQAIAAAITKLVFFILSISRDVLAKYHVLLISNYAARAVRRRTACELAAWQSTPLHHAPRPGSGVRILTNVKIVHTPKRQVGRGCAIASFRRKGSKQIFEDDHPKALNAERIRKIKQILAFVEAAENVSELACPTFHLHPLKGGLDGWWSMTVRANRRIIFRFEAGGALDVDLMDCH